MAGYDGVEWDVFSSFYLHVRYKSMNSGEGRCLVVVGKNDA